MTTTSSLPDPSGRQPSVVLREAAAYLAYVATRRLYDEQPGLWRLGEHGRARTLEDFGHHFRALAPLDRGVFAEHVRYCLDLWQKRELDPQWLTDAWRVMADVLRAELPPPVAEPAAALLAAVTANP